MTYLRPHNRNSGRFRAIGIALAVLVLVGLLIEWRAPQLFPGLMTGIASPFWRTSFAIQEGALKSPEQLLKENTDLRIELDALRQQIASSSVGMLIAENEELKAMFHRASSTPYVLAAVLSRPPLLPYDELLIDLGAKDGLSTTTRVYAPGGVLIGRVAEALSRTSRVELLSSPGEKYDVFIGSDRVPAAALGIGGGQYRAEVPHGTPLAVGDAVTAASVSTGSMGIIVSIDTDPADPFDTILFAPDVNVYNLRWVLVDLRPEAKSASAKATVSQSKR
jgi:cell shape-determining protein MreC